jgi:adenylate cyclase
MKLSPQLKSDLSKVAVITVCYILFSLFIAWFIVTITRSPYSLGPSPFFELRPHAALNSLTGLLAGIFGGGMLITVNGRLFRRKSFGFALLTTAVAYVLIFFTINILTTAITMLAESRIEGFSLDAFWHVLASILNPVLLIYFIMWGVITLLTLFFLQVNDKFGPGILLKFLVGQYHQPRKEERIFMFLDMRSSTSIAEKIGNEKYFNLLNDLFSDVTRSIQNNEGEIYQYVGDEIVVSWPMKKGIRNANCLHCFMQIRAELERLGPVYKKKYGIHPELKAGIHFGQVMAGEIGVIKKDIIYSGDVLNTTARIQEQCNPYKVDILISKETFDLIPDPGSYKLVPLGSIELRGKEQKIDLNTVVAI